MKYQFSKNVRLLHNETDYNKLDGNDYLSYPTEYPCLAIGPIFVDNDYGPDWYYYQYVYFQDAQNLIVAFWGKKDK